MSDHHVGQDDHARPEGPLSRRKLMLGGGAAAAGAAAIVVGPGASPAAAADTATNISFVPTNGLQSTNVQDALVELDSEKAGPHYWNVRMFGADPALADNTVKINDALNACAAFGGGTVVLPPGLWKFTGVITVPEGVDLWGTGGHKQTTEWFGSVLKATGVNAQVVFKSTGGQSGNFTVNGNGVANNPNGRGLVYFDFCVERLFTRLEVLKSNGIGAIFDRGQNCTFNHCIVSHSTGDGLVIDKGAGGNAFMRCEFNAAGGVNLKIRETRPMPIPTPTPPAEEGTYLDYPQHNYFLHCIMERGPYPNGTNAAQLQITHGAGLTFNHCIFALFAPNTSSSGAVVILFGGAANFENCWFASDSAVGLRVGAAGAFFIGRNNINTIGTAVEWNTGAYGNVLGTIQYGGSVTAKWAGTGSHSNISSGHDRQLLTSLEAGAGYGFRVARQDEPNGLRFQISNPATTAGRTEIQLSDGTTYNPKAVWRLQSDNTGWETPDDVQLTNNASLLLTGGSVQVDGGAVNIQERTTTPAFPADANDRASVYVKGDRLVVAFRQGATIKYRSMLLSDTTATWTYHGTTAP